MMSAMTLIAQRSEWGQKQTHPPQQRMALFDHIIGAGKQCWRHDETDGLRRLEVDDQFELSRLFDWQIAGLGSFSNLVGHYSRAPEQLVVVCCVGNESACRHLLAVGINGWNSVLN